MPEYLAPGVYVEEVSYRSKPIEGVSTSTAAFAGASRTGPLLGPRDLPPLITNVGQFEELFGGPEDLAFEGVPARPNYLAHAIRAFFAEGGSRVYVVRAFLQSAAGNDTAGAELVAGVGAANQARLNARSPGSGGNYRVFFNRRVANISDERLNAQPEGTMLSVGAGREPQPARLFGNRLPVAVPAGAVLRVEHRGAALADLVFALGARAQVPSAGPLAEPINLAAAPEADRTLLVSLDGGAEQRLVLPQQNFATRQELALALNAMIRGGFVITGGAAPGDPADRLVVGTDSAGAAGSVRVNSVALGFAGAENVTGQGVPDLGNVTAADINALIARALAAPLPIRADTEAGTRRLILRTTNAAAERLRVIDATAPGVVSAHAALGLGLVAADGEAGVQPTIFMRNAAGGWVDAAGAALVRPAANVGVLSYDLTIFDDTGRLRLQLDDVTLGTNHPRSIATLLPAQPATLTERYRQPIAVVIGANVTPFALRTAIDTQAAQIPPRGRAEEARPMFQLAGGTDGAVPAATGALAGSLSIAEALQRLERVEDISIVAAPGSTAGLAANAAGLSEMHGVLIAHAERRRSYRIAVLDTPNDMGLTELREARGRIDSRYAALYYPWIMISNPNVRPNDERQPKAIAVPPSGHIAGIYARNDVERGVFKAPANEVIRQAIGLEADISFGEQQAINPEGINALRLLPGRGYRVWGARLISSDGEWKYVSDRRYFNYLESSIDRGTQWVVFEPNGERLWERLVESVTEFLYAEWRSGALLGGSPREAFFVRCDRSTMSQNDLDSGRLICEIGIALVKPAEFVIFRVGQKTADARN